MTTEELAEMAEAEAGEEEYEAIADGLSGALGARLTTFLNLFVWEKNLGYVFNADTDFVLPGIGNRRPDIAFCSYQTLPELSRTAAPVPPDLAVEVTSSQDEIDDTDRKLGEYLQAGVKLVWIVRPLGQVIEVYKQDGQSDLLRIDRVLAGEPVLRGFRLALRQLFEFPRKQAS